MSEITNTPYTSEDTCIDPTTLDPLRDPCYCVLTYKHSDRVDYVLCLPADVENVSRVYWVTDHDDVPCLTINSEWLDEFQFDAKGHVFEYMTPLNPRTRDIWGRILAIQDERKAPALATLETMRIIETALQGDWKDPVYMERCYDEGRAAYRRVRANILGRKFMHIAGLKQEKNP
jgi:hypothetical protein